MAMQTGPKCMECGLPSTDMLCPRCLDEHHARVRREILVFAGVIGAILAFVFATVAIAAFWDWVAAQNL
jgi:hypothetical protein